MGKDGEMDQQLRDAFRDDTSVLGAPERTDDRDEPEVVDSIGSAGTSDPTPG